MQPNSFITIAEIYNIASIIFSAILSTQNTVRTGV